MTNTFAENDDIESQEKIGQRILPLPLILSYLSIAFYIIIVVYTLPLVELHLLGWVSNRHFLFTTVYYLYLLYILEIESWYSSFQTLFLVFSLYLSKSLFECSNDS